MLLLIATAAILPAGVNAGVSEAAKHAKADENTATEKPKVRLGMTTAELVEAIGQPVQVRKIETAQGRGESWIYRRVFRRWAQQNAAATESVPMYTGLGLDNGAIHSVEVPTFRLEHITEYQVTAILIYDGKVAAAKQWRENERRID